MPLIAPPTGSDGPPPNWVCLSCGGMHYRDPNAPGVPCPDCKPQRFMVKLASQAGQSVLAELHGVGTRCRYVVYEQRWCPQVSVTTRDELPVCSYHARRMDDEKARLERKLRRGEDRTQPDEVVGQGALF